MRTVVKFVFAFLLICSAPAYAQIVPGSPTAALFDSVVANDLAGVQASLDAGADILARDQYGNTAADVAVDRGHFDIAHYLLGVMQNQRERTAQAVEDAAAQPVQEAIVPQLPAPDAPQRASPTLPDVAAKTEAVPFSGPSPFDVEVPRSPLPSIAPPVAVVPSAPAPSVPVEVTAVPPVAEPVPMSEPPVPLPAVPADTPPPEPEAIAEPEPEPAPDAMPESVPAPVTQEMGERPAEPSAATPKSAPASPENEDVNSFMSDFLSFILPDQNQQPAAPEPVRAASQNAAAERPAAIAQAPETNRIFGAVLGLALGTPRGAQHFETQTSCLQKTPALAVCIEPVSWPDDVLAHDAEIESGVYRRTVGDRRLRGVVGYENGVAAYVHTIVAAADFDATVTHLTGLFGPPDTRTERVAAPLGQPRAVNRVYTWFGRDATSGERMHVEIMNFDDTRDIFPKMTEAAIVVQYEGAKPAFAYVTPIELIGLF